MSAAQNWSKYMGVQRTFNLIDRDTGEVFTEDDMEEFAFDLAPKGVRSPPSVWEWVAKLMSTWNSLKAHIPDAIINRTKQPPNFKK